MPEILWNKQRTVHDAKAVMRKMVDMFATGDLAGAESVVAVDYVDHQGDVETDGLDGFRDLVRTVHAPREGAVDVRIDDLTSEGDRVATRLRWHHTKAVIVLGIVIGVFAIYAWFLIGGAQ